MNASERLEASAERFADSLSRTIETRVKLALRLEADRHDDAIDSLARDVRELRRYVEQLHALVLADNERHSVRVDP